MVCVAMAHTCAHIEACPMVRRFSRERVAVQLGHLRPCTTSRPSVSLGEAGDVGIESALYTKHRKGETQGRKACRS